MITGTSVLDVKSSLQFVYIVNLFSVEGSMVTGTSVFDVKPLLLLMYIIMPYFLLRVLW